MAGKGQGQSAGRQYAAHVYDVFGQTKFQAGPVGDCLYDAVAGAHDQAHIKSEGGSDPDQYDCQNQYQNARGKCLRGRDHRGIEVEKTGEEYAERQLQNIHDNCFLLVGRSSFSVIIKGVSSTQMYAFLKNMNYIYHFKDYRHMKKILNILIVLFMATGAYAQSLVSGSSSKTLQLLEADGSFLVKSFYDLATVKEVDCKVLIITDAFSGKKMQGDLNEDKKAVQEEGGIAQLNPAEF